MADIEITETTAEEQTEEHTGVMIALFLSPEHAATLALPEGSLGAKDQPSKAEELHLTLAYLGDVNNHAPEIKLRLLYNLKWFAESYKPLTGILGGLGVFNSAEAPYPLVGLFDSPMLEYFRMSLKAAMQSEGIYPAANHGFTPHVTLAYLDKPKFPTVEIPNQVLTFGAVSMAWGNERYDFPLGSYFPEESFSEFTVKATQANYGAKAGQAIRGKLVRASNGQFGSGGSTAPVNSTPKKGAKTEEAKAKAKEDVAAAKAADKEAADSEATDAMYERFGDTLVSIGADSDIVEVMSVGDEPGDISGANPETQKKLEAAGLGKTYADGTFDLTPAGRSLVKAAKKGDSKMAKRALATAQAQANKRSASAAKKAAAAGKKKTKKEISSTPILGSTFKAYEDGSGSFRWVTSSSSGFRDKDGHFVTTKALNEDVDRSYRENPDKNFGPLLWHHVPGLVIGNCDFRAMSGHTLIESGTFTKKEYAEALVNYSKKVPLGTSIGFQNLIIEPDNEGAFNWITTKERSLLPEVKASNWLAKFITTNFIQKEKNMLPDKIQEFHKVLGGSPEALTEINNIISQTAQTEKSALDAGLTVKETSSPAPAEDADDTEFIDTMTVKEFQGYVAEQIKTAQAPVVEALNNVASFLKGQQTKEVAATTELTTTVKSQGETIKSLEAQIAALTADTPKAFNSLRASQQEKSISTGVITNKETSQPVANPANGTAPNMPGPDSMDDFLGSLQIKLS